MIKALSVVLSLLFMTLVTVRPAAAQSTDAPKIEQVKPFDKRKLLVQPKNPDGTVKTTPFMEDPVLWMRTMQQNFYGRMSRAMLGMMTKSATSATWTLFMLSFLYGVFHAAGPGHGKAVVSAWVLATENELKRGIIIAGLSALIQALAAIMIVSALLLLVKSASTMARDIAGFLESASYAMIAAMGLYLAWSGWPTRKAQTAPSDETKFELVSRPNEGTTATFEHVHDANCGHVHAPSPTELKGDWSWRRAFALSFAVGIRPCSGALLVLIFANSIGLYWAGVAATLAMGFGVFLTVSAIAAASVFAKSLALRFTAADNPLLGLVARTGKIVVGLAIACLGGLLFAGSLGGNNIWM